MIEVFKDIPNYEGVYQVSNLGNVKGLDRQVYNGKGYYTKKSCLLKNVLGSKGYFTVSLHNKGVKTNYQTHLLVAIAFLGHTPNGHSTVVDHIDNNPLNNSLSNLQVISNRMNLSKDKNGGSSKYTGVSWDKSRGKWIASIVYNGRSVFLGRFTKEKEASEAYNIELSLINKSN